MSGMDSFGFWLKWEEGLFEGMGWVLKGRFFRVEVRVVISYCFILSGVFGIF